MKILTLDMKGASMGDPGSIMNKKLEYLVERVDVACFQNVKPGRFDLHSFAGFSATSQRLNIHETTNIIFTRLTSWKSDHPAPDESLDGCHVVVMHLEDPFSDEDDRLSVCSVSLNPQGKLGYHAQVSAIQTWLFRNSKTSGGSHLVVGAFHTPRLSDYREEERMHVKHLASDENAISLMDKAGYVDAYRLHLMTGENTIRVRKPLDFPFSPKRYTRSLDHPPFCTSYGFIGTGQRKNEPEFRAEYVFASPALSKRMSLKSYSHQPVTTEFGSEIVVFCEYAWK